MKKVKHLLVKILVYVFIAGVLGGGGWWGMKLYKKTSGVEAEIDKVTVTRGDIELKFQDIGEIAPKHIVEVYPRVGGSVSEIRVNEGTVIKRGEIAAIIQPGHSDADKYLPVEVTAPIDGVVVTCENRSWNEEGQIARTGQRVSGLYDSGNPSCLMRIADFSKMVVKLNVSEMEILKLKKGMPVGVDIDALGFKKFSGKITMMSPQAEKDQRHEIRSFRVEVEIAQKDADLKPGMTAKIETIINSKKNVLILPLSGLFEEKGMNFAYLYVPGAKARKTPVKTGLRNETDVEIIEGLKQGDQAYTDKPLNLEEADDKIRESAKNVSP
ncbi:MAG: efflux RND transporter periplasmic adaptor subunit [Elusimicrobia bacterium]|nr:efflux RND transporter periplasmic adaptor subunit [Elusimicrobiota bacterium]